MNYIVKIKVYTQLMLFLNFTNVFVRSNEILQKNYTLITNRGLIALRVKNLGC
jgi:hypothetical protein